MWEGRVGEIIYLYAQLERNKGKKITKDTMMKNASIEKICCSPVGYKRVKGYLLQQLAYESIAKNGYSHERNS